jgi:hypothetical protein
MFRWRRLGRTVVRRQSAFGIVALGPGLFVGLRFHDLRWRTLLYISSRVGEWD